MSPGAKMECLESVYLRYKRAPRKEKTLILNEFCATCGYHRKHAIRVLNDKATLHLDRIKQTIQVPVVPFPELAKA